MPIKLSVAPQQFVDEAGKPIAGRVTFYKHNSNELATIYTMEGNSFVLAQNPQLLNAMGAIQETVFFDADILDMKVERYIGQPDAMDVLSPDFASFDQFEVGMDYKALLEQAGTVASIADLKEVDPSEFKAIQVQDVPWRVYIWDEFATNTPDDGIVVQSDVTSDGRWLLLWDDEMLPSSIYGVKDGDFSNLTACLSYPEIVGSIGLWTPPVVRIVPGTYHTTTWVSSTKTIAFGKNAKFTGGGIICPRARQISDTDTYFCDLEFTDPNAEAHSSWFRTVGGFWRSKAGKLIMDRTNYFALSVLDSVAKVEQAVIEGVERMGSFTTQANYLWLERCSIQGKRLFSGKDDYIRFAGMEVDDSIFITLNVNQWDLGRISAGHHIECLTLGSCTYPLARFKDATLWMKFYDVDQANSVSPKVEIDLQNREVSHYAYTRYSIIRNMVVTGDMSLPTNNTVLMYNVHVNGYLYGGMVLSVTNSTVTLADTDHMTAFSAADSTVRSFGSITHAIAINCSRCRYGIHVNNATDNETDVGSVILSDCTVLDENVTLKTKKLYLYNCTLYNPYITIWPYYDGSNYRIDGAMIGCTFLGGHDIYYTKNHVGQYGSEEPNCHHVVFTYRWINNGFYGTMPKGILIDLWAVKNDHQFFVSRMDNDVIYRGNFGNCPVEKIRCNENFSSTETTYRFFNDGAWTYTQWYIGGFARIWRAMPDFNSRTAGGIFARFAELQYKYASGFTSYLQTDVCTDLMEDPDSYGDFSRVCFGNLSQVTSQHCGIV